MCAPLHGAGSQAHGWPSIEKEPSSPKEHRAKSGDIVVLSPLGVGLPLASNGQNPQILLSTLQCTGEPPLTKNHLVQNISSAVVESPLVYMVVMLLHKCDMFTICNNNSIICKSTEWPDSETTVWMTTL